MCQDPGLALFIHICVFHFAVSSSCLCWVTFLGMCFSIYVLCLSDCPHIWPLLSHLCLIDLFLPYFWNAHDSIIILSALLAALPGPQRPQRPQRPHLQRLEVWNKLLYLRTAELMSQRPVYAFVSPLITESINPDHISDCWIFKLTVSMRSPSQMSSNDSSVKKVTLGLVSGRKWNGADVIYGV